MEKDFIFLNSIGNSYTLVGVIIYQLNDFVNHDGGVELKYVPLWYHDNALFLNASILPF